MNRFLSNLLLWFIANQTSVAQLPSSCENPIKVCNLDTIHIRSHSISTPINDIIDDFCGVEDMEVSSLYEGANWLRYEFTSSGDFLFTLYPNSMHTDLDFFVFQSQKDCTTLDNIRCVLSGSDDDSRCRGTTGLSYKADDKYEYAGCDYFDDNYAAPIQVNRGDIIYLAIYNFSRNGTVYRIAHNGSAQLSCNSFLYPTAVAEIYPNPSAGQLRISGRNITSQRVGIEIFDKEHQIQIRESVVLDKSIDISHLPSGVYIIKIHEYGQLINSQRFINIK